MLLNDPPRSIVAALRGATGGDHDRVDAAYGGFDLAALLAGALGVMLFRRSRQHDDSWFASAIAEDAATPAPPATAASPTARAASRSCCASCTPPTRPTCAGR